MTSSSLSLRAEGLSEVEWVTQLFYHKAYLDFYNLCDRLDGGMGKHIGLTKIELLVVLVLLGLLLWAVSFVFNPVELLKENRDAQRKKDIQSMQTFLESYYANNSRYPPSSANFQFVRSDGTEVPWGGIFLSTIIPKDPTSNRRYVYIASENGQAYYLYANVESKDASAPVNVMENVFCGENNLPCNHGVSSKNVSP